MKSYYLLPRVVRAPIGHNATTIPAQLTTGASWRLAALARLYSTKGPTEEKPLQTLKDHSLLKAVPPLPATAESGETLTAYENQPPPAEDADANLVGVRAGKNRKQKQFRREPDHPTRVNPNEVRVFDMNPIEFRKLMSQVPQPVVVISSLQLPPLLTTEKGPLLSRKAMEEENPRPKLMLSEEESKQPIPRAMTVSSFTSLSLDPLTSVTFNINLPSHTYEAIATSHRFNVHVLSNNEDGAQLAKRFAQAGYSRLDEKPGPEDGNRGAELARDLDLQVMGTSNWESEWAQRVKEHLADRKSPTTRMWLPLSREAIPVLMNPGILYTLRCVVRPPREKHAIHQKSGLIQLDEGNVIVVGDVEDCIIHHTHGFESHIPQDDIALSYVQKQYMMAGVPRKLSEPAPHDPK